ncbi:peroxidase A2-like [Chenopodium quinoa]|uniref:Peroxidase n=1 Tax=Chenopodium quinoa TaxID=63459 RepID=A0A803N4T1_CHEQI|nr:peroxidase A2-like [Chenopodium quinoa]
MAVPRNLYWFSLLPLTLLFVAFRPSSVNSSVGDSSSPPLLDANFSHRRLLQASEQLNLLYDFYRLSCPNAESVVFQFMQNTVAVDSRATAQLLRLMFHDCFIQGCDASLLLDDSNGNQSHFIERNAFPNQSLKGLEIIDRIKQALEAECPGVVSCSDIISLATRDAIILSGGPFFPILTGRRDSQASYYDEANQQIPRPDSNITEMLDLFSQKGFNEKEIVSLLGAHNIGKIGCEFIQRRLSNFKGTGEPDPTIPADFLLELKRICNADASPSPSPSRLRNLIESASGLPFHQSLAPFIFSGSGFDAHYYKGLIMGRGLLYADQQLMADPRTAKLVEVFASDDGSTFRREFSKSMLKMSNLAFLTGSQGEVRTRCSLPNNI